jgi:hypothetical protein
MTNYSGSTPPGTMARAAPKLSAALSIAPSEILSSLNPALKRGRHILRRLHFRFLAKHLTKRRGRGRFRDDPRVPCLRHRHFHLPRSARIEPGERRADQPGWLPPERIRLERGFTPLLK